MHLLGCMNQASCLPNLKLMQCTLYSPCYNHHSSIIFSDGDGALDLLLPVCTTDDCTESFLYVYSWTNEQVDIMILQVSHLTLYYCMV